MWRQMCWYISLAIEESRHRHQSVDMHGHIATDVYTPPPQTCALQASLGSHVYSLFVERVRSYRAIWLASQLSKKSVQCVNTPSDSCLSHTSSSSSSFPVQIGIYSPGSSACSKATTEASIDVPLSLFDNIPTHCTYIDRDRQREREEKKKKTMIMTMERSQIALVFFHAVVVVLFLFLLFFSLSYPAAHGPAMTPARQYRPRGQGAHDDCRLSGTFPAGTRRNDPKGQKSPCKLPPAHT